MAEPTGPDISATGAGSPATPAGAAPATPGKETPKPPEGFVPIAALQGEQEVTKRERERADQYRAHMELQGFRFGEDGSVSAPQQPHPEIPAPPPPQNDPVAMLANDPDVQAASQGIATAEQYVRAHQKITDARMMQAAPSFMAPAATVVYGQKRNEIATKYRNRPEIVQSFEEEVRAIEGQFQGQEWRVRQDPQMLKIAEAFAVTKHIGAIEAAAEERGRNPGKVVGRFSEGAAPGTGQPVVESYSPERVAQLRAMGFTDAEIEKAAQSREVSGRYGR